MAEGEGHIQVGVVVHAHFVLSIMQAVQPTNCCGSTVPMLATAVSAVLHHGTKSTRQSLVREQWHAALCADLLSQLSSRGTLFLEFLP